MTGGAAGLEGLVTGSLFFALNFALVVGLTAVGALVCERAGVLNLGLEGVLLMGCVVGFTVAHYTESGLLGLGGGLLIGLGLGLLKAIWSVGLKTEQVINGLVLVTICTGLSNLIYQHAFAGSMVAPRLAPMANLAIPLLSRIPIIGPAFFNRSLAVYLAFALIAVVGLFLYHTRAGMMIRAVGEAPEAADFNGVAVDGYRTLAVLIGCAVVGFAGALLSVDQLYLFHPAMTAGRGWIAVAIVVVGGWRPWPVLLVALLFGLTDVFQFQIQIQNSSIPYELLLSLPYLVTIAVLALRRRSVRPPAALGTPYTK